MATKKLQWSRTNMMQHQYGATKRAACWAAVIESTLAFYSKTDKTTPLTFIEQQFETAGGKFGKDGIKDFAEALKFFTIYADHRKGADKFQGKYTQMFNFLKSQIDKGNPVLLGFEILMVGQRHAGMVFGYEEPGKVFFIEPARLAMKPDGEYVFDDKMEHYYVTNAVTVEALLAQYTLRAETATGPAIEMVVDAVYTLKSPTAGAAAAGGAGNLVTAVI